jgi:hypothetical protein
MDGTATGPVFLNAAQDLLHKIDRDDDPKPLVLANETRELIDRFRRWGQAKPDPGERADAVNAFIELNRKVLIYVSRKTRA